MQLVQSSEYQMSTHRNYVQLKICDWMVWYNGWFGITVTSVGRAERAVRVEQGQWRECLIHLESHRGTLDENFCIYFMITDFWNDLLSWKDRLKLHNNVFKDFVQMYDRMHLERA